MSIPGTVSSALIASVWPFCDAAIKAVVPRHCREIERGGMKDGLHIQIELEVGKGRGRGGCKGRKGKMQGRGEEGVHIGDANV